MRHTITVTVEVEAEHEDRDQVIQDLLGLIVDIQCQECDSAEVLPSGEEINATCYTMSVASAKAKGAKITAGWAVRIPTSPASAVHTPLPASAAALW